jgi:hypothetical protein
MRFLHIDREDIHARGKVTLERTEESGMDSITLTIHALPPTYAQDAEMEVPSPQRPRIGISRNKKGIIDKDGQGRPIMLYDEENPDYQAELREVQQLQAVKMIVDALDPAEAKFETRRDSMPPKEYYKRIREEMREYGLSLGDYVTLVRAITNVSNLSEEDVEAAGLDFFGTASSRRRSSNIGSAGRWAGASTAGQPSPSENAPDGSQKIDSSEPLTVTGT